TFQPDALAEELADVAMYLFQLADLVGVDLAQAIEDKIAVNMGRTWTPRDPHPAPLPEGEGESSV
ncbi:MAG: hypothetical protein KIS91_14585, partial [Anaerolineae bacterium]|nr:hypothetical protein [Anaerolineae bacterium]